MKREKIIPIAIVLFIAYSLFAVVNPVQEWPEIHWPEWGETDIPEEPWDRPPITMSGDQLQQAIWDLNGTGGTVYIQGNTIVNVSEPIETNNLAIRGCTFRSTNCTVSGNYIENVGSNGFYSTQFGK